MGGTRYSVTNRTTRAKISGYDTKNVDDIFTQNRARKAHDSMISKNIKIREARDSDTHPKSFPIILGLDVTGSMGHIPHDLVKEGLPKLMGGIIQNGVPDASLLFLGIGDHECDRFPLQVGQFESGDEELDMWLTRTYIEGGGGGNGGESYLLAWYFAAFHTSTDAFEKRGQKGILITIGDEPNLTSLPSSALKEIMGEARESFNESKLLNEVRKKYDVFHINVCHSAWAETSEKSWKNTLGQNCISVSDYKTIPDVIKKLVCENHTSKIGTTYKSDSIDTGFDNIEML